MTLYGHFLYNLYIFGEPYLLVLYPEPCVNEQGCNEMFLCGLILQPIFYCYILNCVVKNSVIKSLYVGG